MKPVTFVNVNTSLGKPKKETIRALLDSGASTTLMLTKYAKKLRVKSNKHTVWSTPAGEFSTSAKTRVQMILPELHDNRLIEWKVHLSESLGNYYMIIGRDLL